MILAIDIGNTQTCVGTFEDDSNYLKNLWRFSTSEKITVDEVSADCMQIINQSDFDLDDINTVAISCVVPGLTVFYNKALNAFIQKQNLNVKIVNCNGENAKKLDSSIYDCKYPYPQEVGADVIATSIAAKAMYKTPCVVIDFGTATTFNVINNKGEFLGGIICPGLKTSLKALLTDAGSLSDIEIKVPEKIIGDTTSESLQNGIVVGEAIRADGFIERIEKEFGMEVNVICTGGWSKLLYSEMKHKVIWNPSLLLQGLKIFVENFNV